LIEYSKSRDEEISRQKEEIVKNLEEKSRLSMLKAEEMRAKSKSKKGKQKQNQEIQEAKDEIPISEETLFFHPEPSSSSIAKPSQSSSTTLGSDTSYKIIIPGSSSSLPWYNPTPAVLPPSNSPARLEVFKSLRARGYWLASGLKFGGDFTAYPGDPLRFHSHFVVTVIDNDPLRASCETQGRKQVVQEDEGEKGDKEISMMEIIAWGRLATGVKKHHLLGGYRGKDSPVSYLTISWSGFG
jgi:tRNA-splicing endonuclease subunit Sen34